MVKKILSKKKKRYGLALSGGAALGAYQAGALKAIFEAGLDIRAVAGSSIGALNGYLAATGQISELLNFWRSIDQKKLITMESFAKFFFTGANALLSDQMQRTLVNQAVSLASLNFSERKYRAAAISLKTGKLHYLRGEDAQTDEELRDFVLASAAVPGVFPPIKIKDEYFIDGGLVRNTPIDALESERIDSVIAISMEPEEYADEEKINTSHLALRTVSIFFRSQANDAVERAARSPKLRKKKIYLLRPQHTLGMQQYEFDSKKIEQLIEQGYNTAKEFIFKQRLR